MIPAIGLLVGIVLGLFLQPTVPVWLQPYLPIVLVAALIVFLGDQLGVGSQMSTGVVVVLSMRIFANVAAIRRHLLKA